MRILIDLDDVLFPLLEPWVFSLNAKYCTNVLPSEITSWDIAKFFPTLTIDQVFQPLFNELFWKRLKPIPGAVETVKRFIQEGYNVSVVTASYHETISWKMNNLFKWFPFLKWDDVIVTHNNKTIKGDILIDDAPQNLIGGDYEKILFRTHSNIQFDITGKDIWEVYGWDEVYWLVDLLAKRKAKKR